MCVTRTGTTQVSPQYDDTKAHCVVFALRFCIVTRLLRDSTVSVEGAVNMLERSQLVVDVEYVSMARDGAEYAYGKLRTRRMPKSRMAIEGSVVD